MAKNDTAALLGALVVTVGLLGGGAWWFLQQKGGIETVLPGGTSSSISGSNVAIADRLSFGEKLLLQSDQQPSKLQGIAAYAQGDYTQAQQFLQQALTENKNDPETLIYLNNSKASLAANPLAIAVTVSMPVDTDTGGAKEILRGVAQAQKEFNDGGQALKVLIADDDGDVAIAPKIAEELAKKTEILGVIGHFSSDTSLAAAKVYEAQKLVMISPTSTSTSLSTAGDYIFRTVPSDRFAGNALANHLLNQLKVKNVAIFYNAASDYSNSLKDSLTTDLFSQGGSVVAEVDVNQAAFNGAQALSDVQAKGAQAIALVSNTATLNQALQVIQVNEGKLPIVAGDSLYKPEVLQIGGRDAEGMVLAVPWHILSNPNAIFPKTSRNLWGGDVNWRTALSYDAAQSLITALQQNPSPTRQNIQITLTNPNFSAVGAAQSIQFLPSGDRNQAEQMVIVKKGDRSGFGYDFVPIN
jgi:branched-chain amino acid transport system substrate-binding protein